jgi:hypothetical protein
MSITSSATKIVEKYSDYAGSDIILSTQIDHEDVEQLRDEYLQVFDRSGKTRAQALEIVRTNFTLAPDLFVTERTTLQAASDEPYELLYNGEVHIIPPNTPVLVGLYGDVRTLQFGGNSRVQFIVYYYPTLQILNKPVAGSKGVVIVIDPGSMLGLKYDSGSATGLPSSLPNDRNLIVFSPAETVSFMVPGIASKYIFNPKKCVVCLDRHRSIKLVCGHFVLCNECSIRIERCPVCRAPSDRGVQFSGCFSNV